MRFNRSTINPPDGNFVQAVTLIELVRAKVVKIWAAKKKVSQM